MAGHVGEGDDDDVDDNVFISTTSSADNDVTSATWMTILVDGHVFPCNTHELQHICASQAWMGRLVK